MQSKTTANRKKGILFILSAAFFFSLMTVFVRLSGDVPTMQKAFFRSAREKSSIFPAQA